MLHYERELNHKSRLAYTNIRQSETEPILLPFCRWGVKILPRPKWGKRRREEASFL